MSQPGFSSAAHDHNRRAWDDLVRARQSLTRPARDEEFANPLAVVDGCGWLGGDIRGKMVLCLAAGGGRQSALYAAAGGVVVLAEHHPIWGNFVEIDHGNQLLTRYAHASRLAVAPGDLVKRGQKIAEVGSTGRSTGPHLHFEVHHRGVAQNPSRFLFAEGGPLQQPAAGTGKVDLKALAAAAGARN